jgi:hypothetical protein
MSRRDKKKSGKKEAIHLPGGITIDPNPKQPFGNSVNRPPMIADWWSMDSDEAAMAVVDAVNFWTTNQRWRMQQYHRLARLYGNLPGGLWLGQDTSRVSALANRLRHYLTANVCKSCVDTLAAKVGKSTPKVYFVSSDGNYKAQRQCRSLNTFLDGLFESCHVAELAEQALRDCLIWGEGWIRVYARKGKVAMERVPLDEIWVDVVEAMTSPTGPSQLSRCKLVDRQRLLGEFPDAAEIIEAATAGSWNEGNLLAMSLADPVGVIESWRLPTDTEPGKHMISVDTGPLIEIEDYDHETFPFTRLVYSPRPFGWFASGLIEELEPTQREIDGLYAIISEAIDLCSAYKVFIKNGSGINANHIDDTIGPVLTGEEPPVWLINNAVPQQMLDWVNINIQRAYEISGINQVNASGMVQSNLKSGEAIRVQQDVTTERFSMLEKGFDRLVVEIGKLGIRTVQDIMASGGKSYKVTASGKTTSSVIDWADIDYDPDVFTIKPYSTPSLPTDPAGRFEKINEFAQAGYIDPDTARTLLDFPDLDREENMFRQMRDRISKSLDKIIDEGEYDAPDAYDNLQLAHLMALRAYKWSQNHDVPDNKLLLLQRYIAEVVRLLAMANPPPPPAGGAAGGMAPANPEPTPTSPLIPNVNAPGQAA